MPTLLVLDQGSLHYVYGHRKEREGGVARLMVSSFRRVIPTGRIREEERERRPVWVPCLSVNPICWPDNVDEASAPSIRGGFFL